MKKIILFVLLSFFILLNLNFAWAEEEKEKSLEAIELMTGFGWGWEHLKFDGDYNQFPVIIDFDFNLKPLTKKINIDPPSLLQFQIEPFISTISSPRTNVELGAAFFLKIGLTPQTWKFQPYIKAGAGLDYMSLHTQEQSTQFNFIECAGIGAHYFFKKNLGLTLEARIRHLSNSGIKEPNHGINSYFALGGLTYQF